MEINPLKSTHVDASKLSLDSLAASTQVTQQEKVSEVSRVFEALLLRQILQESQRPAFPSKLIGNSTADGIYRDLVTTQLADSISSSGNLGLGRSLASDLQDQPRAAKAARGVSGNPQHVAASGAPAAAKNPHLESPKHD
jgi:Rod binding domain-containing protein